MKKPDPLYPDKPDAAKMEAALIAAEEAIDHATDVMFFGEGQPVTALESWEIEDIYLTLCGVKVQMDEALAHRRNSATGSKADRHEKQTQIDPVSEAAMKDDITRRIDHALTDDIHRYSKMDSAMAYAAIVMEWPEQIAVLILELLFKAGGEKRQDANMTMLAKRDGSGGFFTTLYPDRKTHPYMR